MTLFYLMTIWATTARGGVQKKQQCWHVYSRRAGTREQSPSPPNFRPVDRESKHVNKLNGPRQPTEALCDDNQCKCNSYEWETW